MSEPKLCKWCGSAQSGTDGDDILFACGSWHSGSTPEYQWVQCRLNVAEQRIRRALAALHEAVTDSVDVDRAIQILQEGQQ